MPKFYNKVPFAKNTNSYWAEINPVLLDGEVILVSNDNDNSIRLKVGDGVSTYSELDYIGDENGVNMKVGDGVSTYAQLDYVTLSSRTGIGTEEYEALIQMIEANTLRIDSNLEQINTHETSIETNETNIETLTNITNELKPEVERISTEVANAASQIDGINVKADGAVSSVNEFYNTIVELEAASRESLSQVSTIHSEVAAFRLEIDGVDEAINKNATDIADITTSVTEHGTNLVALGDSVGTLTEQVGTLTTDVSTNKENLKVLQDRVQNIISAGGGGGDGEGGGSSIEVIDIRQGYDGTTYETAGEAVRAIGTKLAEHMENPIDPEDLGLERDTVTGLVHPTYKGVRSSKGIPLSAGGGGGGGETIFRLRSTTEALDFSTSYGADVLLTYTFSSLDPYDGSPTGNGTATFSVNSNVVYSESIPQGDNSFECGSFLKEGTNEVKLVVKNADGESKQLVWTINCISIRLTSTFDYTLAYTDSVTFNYTAYGDASKKVYFIFDGVQDPEVPVITSSGRQNTKIFEGLRHGLHTLEVYAIANINGKDIKSNVLKYDIIVVGQNAVIPIISINCNTEKLLQGELLSIPYIVYDPLSTESNVNLDIHVLNENNEWELYKTETRVVDRGLQLWNTRYYPLGDVKFTVRLREISRSYIIHVDEFYLPIEPVTNDMELYLTSANRSNSETNPAIWEYNGITTEFNNVNWASSGWIEDTNGDTSLHLTGGSTAVIKYKPFATDLRVFGRTLEFEFAVRDVNNRDANVISCKQGGIGIEVTADNATLNSNLAKVDCHFNDERKIRVSFTIESRSEYRMMSVYLDGVLTSCKQYVTTDNFQQTNPVEITIGSPYCSVDLYTVRAYSTALTQNEIISNYICDKADVTEKATLYDANNLYDISMNLDYGKVKTKIPVMTITGSLPAYKGDKKKVDVDYEDPFDSSMNFSFTETSIDVQGTSSQWYVRKNYKLKFPSKFAHIKGGIATKTYCMKADYAEATSTHNTQNANMIHYLYSDKTPAQEDNPMCRTTIEGFPCVIYHKDTIDSEPYFLGKYNFNYDKGSEEAFGFTDNYEVESWEFCNNTSVACNFTGYIPAEYEMTDENDNEVGWVNDFERRYPDHDYIDEGPEIPNEAIARFRAMHTWVVDTANYDLNNPADLERYRTEFEELFNLHKVLIYYVWTFFFLMVDQRAKNMFMTYWGKTGKWEPWFYDNDTCLGINNEGQMVFDYYHEDTDLMPDNTKVYNGQDSVLWNKFRVAFAAEIQETYQQLRASNKLSYNVIRDQFVTKGSDMWSETIYNEDSDFKYISMLRSSGDATNLPQIKGTGEHHLEYFLDGRLNYCDSKWYAGGAQPDKEKPNYDPGYVNDFVVLRVNTPTVVNSSVMPNANITITPFSNMYAGVRYRANGTLQQKRLEKNETYTFIAPADNFNDTETAIYGASQISSLGDLSPLYCNYCDVSSATKLIELKLGTEDTDYESRLETLSLGTNRLLKKLDIRNCKSLHNPVDLSGCPSIEEVYAEGSSISSLNLSDSGYLRVVHLPATVSNLTIKNQQYIEDFSIESYKNIKELNIENTPSLPLTDILLDTPELERVRLTNVEWRTTEEGLRQTYQKLLTCGGIDETGANINKAVVSGIVDVPSIEEDLLRQINTDFPELMISVNGRVLCTISYYNWDGTLMYVSTVIQGDNAPDIVADGTIPTPVREQTETHKYEYHGWSDSLENIQRSRSFVAMYDVYYAVNFMMDDTVLYREYIIEGGTIENPITSGMIQTPLKDSTAQFHFSYSHWDGDYSVIKDVTYVHAVFIEELRSYTITFYNKDDNNEDVILERKVLFYGDKVTYTGPKPQKYGVAYPQDYKFLGWTPELGTVEGETNYYAHFADSDHILDSWDTIAASVRNGTYKQKYPLGVMQRVVLTYNYPDGSTSSEEAHLELVGYDHDRTENGGIAAMTFIMKNVLTEKYRMNNSQDLNTDGWAECDMRQYLIETVLPALPEEITKLIVPVVKKTSIGSGNTDSEAMDETVDTIWLPALVELVDSYEGTKIYSAEGSTYDYYRTTADAEEAKKKRIKTNSGGYAQRYWTRTPVPYSTNEYWMISQLGGGISTYASYSKQGVVFGFCIGTVV